MKTKAILLAMCLLGSVAKAQNTYAIDQPLGGAITNLMIYKGWDVRLVRDTKNMISILTPCEYYFGEGNEPQICKLDKDGWLTIWENRSMPQGTVLELHLKDNLEQLCLYPEARLSADTIVLNDEFAKLTVMKGAWLDALCVRSNKEWAEVRVEQEAVAHIGLLTSPKYTYLRTLPKATLTVDSLDCPEVKYYRNPKATDNLPASDTARHLTVKTRNRWYHEAAFDASVNMEFSYNATLGHARYNSPHASVFDFDLVYAALRRNPVHINWDSPWAVSWAFDFDLHMGILQNNVKTQDHLLVLDQAENNRNAVYSYFASSVALNLHYIPRSEFVPFADIRLGLRPTLIFGEQLFQSRITEDNKVKSSVEHIRDFNHFNLRLETAYRLRYFEKLEFGLFVDLLPTYRKGTDLETHHNFGFYIRF